MSCFVIWAYTPASSPSGCDCRCVPLCQLCWELLSGQAFHSDVWSGGVSHRRVGQMVFFHSYNFTTLGKAYLPPHAGAAVGYTTL